MKILSKFLVLSLIGLISTLIGCAGGSSGGNGEVEKERKAAILSQPADAYFVYFLSELRQRILAPSEFKSLDSSKVNLRGIVNAEDFYDLCLSRSLQEMGVTFGSATNQYFKGCNGLIAINRWVKQASGELSIKLDGLSPKELSRELEIYHELYRVLGRIQAPVSYSAIPELESDEMWTAEGQLQISKSYSYQQLIQYAGYLVYESVSKPFDLALATIGKESVKDQKVFARLIALAKFGRSAVAALKVRDWEAKSRDYGKGLTIRERAVIRSLANNDFCINLQSYYDYYFNVETVFDPLPPESLISIQEVFVKSTFEGLCTSAAL